MTDPDASSVEEQLLQLFARLAQAERELDIDSLDAFLADDYIGIAATGEIVSKQILLERFRDPELTIEQHEASDLRVVDLGEAGLIMGTARLSGRAGGARFGGTYRFTDICVRRGGAWKVIGSQMTPTTDDVF